MMRRRPVRSVAQGPRVTHRRRNGCRTVRTAVQTGRPGAARQAVGSGLLVHLCTEIPLCVRRIGARATHRQAVTGRQGWRDPGIMIWAAAARAGARCGAVRIVTRSHATAPCIARQNAFLQSGRTGVPPEACRWRPVFMQYYAPFRRSRGRSSSRPSRSPFSRFRRQPRGRRMGA